MIDKLILPMVGDRVRLVNTNGDEATVTALKVLGQGIETKTNFYHYEEGWTVVEILAKPFPQYDTLIHGVLHEDDEPFVGCTTGDSVQIVSASGFTGRLVADAVKSWEVVQWSAK